MLYKTWNDVPWFLAYVTLVNYGILFGVETCYLGTIVYCVKKKIQKRHLGPRHDFFFEKTAKIQKKKKTGVSLHRDRRIWIGDCTARVARACPVALPHPMSNDPIRFGQPASVSSLCCAALSRAVASIKYRFVLPSPRSIRLRKLRSRQRQPRSKLGRGSISPWSLFCFAPLRCELGNTGRLWAGRTFFNWCCHEPENLFLVAMYHF